MKFTATEVEAGFAITQVIHEWATELDTNDGRAMARLVAPDCVYVVRAEPRTGRDAVAAFYAGRYDQLVADMGRTPSQRHIISNIRFDFDDASRVKAAFTLTYYASTQAIPVENFEGPVAVADCQMAFTCDATHGWQIAHFDSAQSFRRPLG